MKKVIIVFISSLLVISSGWAKSHRVAQLPNGSKFGCTNCHTGYGGPRNEFGKVIGTSYLDGSGNVVWGAELAALDSDNDGGSNGTELLDPDGAWTIGDANPGNADDVSNPGDAASISAVKSNVMQEFSFALTQNYPNPFNASTRIDIQIAHTEHVYLVIYNLLGNVVKVLEDSALQPGFYSYSWDGDNGKGNEPTSGIYFLHMHSESFSKTVRMLMVK